MKLVRGVGINDRKYSTMRDGKACREYILWSSMLKRCYSAAYLLAKPSYVGCSVSDNFKMYSYFYEWCNSQIGFSNPGWCLDKDLLSTSWLSKQYHEDLCVFIPEGINGFLVRPKVPRAGLPMGVEFREYRGRNRYRAACKYKNKNTYLGEFDTAEQAHARYLEFKVSIAKDLANQYKDQLDPRAYLALMNYSG